MPDRSSSRASTTSGRRSSIAIKQEAIKAIKAQKVAFDYNVDVGILLMFRYEGTFWPLVRKQAELYLYPSIHLILVIAAWTSRKPDSNGDSDFSSLWVDDAYMVPYGTLGLATSLMVFFLVFFLSQCYTRFNDFFNTCMDMETAVHEVSMIALTYLGDEEHDDARWDLVRYMVRASFAQHP